MDNEREVLAALLYEDGGNFPHWGLLADHLREPWLKVADSVLAAGWRKMDATATKREWPVTKEAVEAYLSTGVSMEKALGTAARFLWRARVEQATEGELVAFLLNLPGLDTLDDCEVVRAALLAMGDL